MTGLEKIIEEIRAQAEKEAAGLLHNAEAEAAKITADYKAQSTAKSNEIAASCDKKVEEIARAGASATELQHRRRMLESKQELIQSTLQMTLQKMYSLPDQEYFALVVKLVAKMAEPKKGQLFLSQKDLDRLPFAYEATITNDLPKGASVEISTEPRQLDGGFILKYDDIEQNGSFKSLLEARHDEFADAISTILFA